MLLRPLRSGGATAIRKIERMQNAVVAVSRRDMCNFAPSVGVAGAQCIAFAGSPLLADLDGKLCDPALRRPQSAVDAVTAGVAFCQFNINYAQ